MTSSLESLLDSDNPLPDDILDILLCQEESNFHDFKLTIDIKSEKEWLKLTKDFLSFANTNGGYIAYGIKNGTKEKIGLAQNVFDHLVDANNILQKINKHINPHIMSIPIKRIEDDKKFIVIHIPQSKNVTHLVEENGTYKESNGEEKIILHKGEIYIRRTGQSLVATHSDFEQLLLRRMIGFRELIFNNVAKTIHEIAPGKQVIIAAENADSSDALIYKYSDAPNALEVRGLPSSTTPRSNEDALCIAIALYKHGTGSLPSKSLLYKFYAERAIFVVQEDYLPYLVKFCVLNNIPVFYWLTSSTKESVSELLRELFENKNSFTKDLILRLSWFVDKKLFKILLSKFGPGSLEKEFKEIKRFDGYNLFISSYLLDGHPQLKGIVPIFKVPDAKLEHEATELALKLHEKAKNKENDRLWTLDCRLYASRIFKESNKGSA
jgi:hypothetical protein